MEKQYLLIRPDFQSNKGHLFDGFDENLFSVAFVLRLHIA